MKSQIATPRGGASDRSSHSFAARRNSVRRHGCLLEALEQRQFLAVVTWDGGPLGTGTDFHLAENWDTDAVPGEQDDAVIPDISGAPLITITQSSSLRSLTASESIRLSTGTLTLSEFSRFNAPFTLQSGTLTGSANVAISDVFVWNGGTMTGTGTTTLEPGVPWTLSGSATRNIFRPLTIDRAFVFSSGTLTGSGQVLIRGDFQWASGTMGGTGATILEPGTEWSISAGTHSIDRPMLIHRPVAFSGGSLSGSGTVTVSSSFNWSGGNESGIGQFIVLSSATLTISGTESKTVRRTLVNEGFVTFAGAAVSLRSVDNRADMIWTSGTLTVTNGTFVNNGTFTANSAADLSLAGDLSVSIVNNGTMSKLGVGTLSLGVQAGNAELQNNGSILALAGGLHINANGSSTGLISGTPESTIRIQSTLIYYSGSLLQSAGTLTLATGNFIFANGTLDVTGVLNLTTGTVSINNEISPSSMGAIGATVTFHRPLNYTGQISIIGDTTTFRHPQTFSSLSLSSGNLRVMGAIVVTENFIWSGGDINGEGELSLLDGVTGSIGGGTKALGLTLTSSAAMSWTGGNIRLTGGAFINNGELTIDSAASFSFVRQGGTNLVVNNGLIIKRGTGAFELIATGTGPAAFENLGKFIVEGGNATFRSVVNRGTITSAVGTTVRFGSPSTNDPASTLQVDGALRFESGNHSFPSGTLASSGSVRVSTGVIVFNNPIESSSISIGNGSLSLSHAHALQSLDLSGGALITAEPITVTDTFAWTGGERTGAGSTIIESGASLSISGTAAKTLVSPLIINGEAVWSGGALQLQSALEVNGSFTADTGTFLTASGSGEITIRGMFIKAGTGQLSLNSSGGALVMEVRTTTTGVLAVVAGSLSANSSSRVSLAGSLSVAAGSTASFESSPDQIVGTTLVGGTWTVAGAISLPLGTAIDWIGPAAIVSLSGPGALVRQGGSDAMAGLHRVDGTLHVGSGAQMEVDPSAAGGVLLNTGTIQVGAGSLLSVEGSYEQASDAHLKLNIAGVPVSSFGRVVLTGSATLDGALMVAYDDSFLPSRGDSFQLLSSTGMNGGFAETFVPPLPDPTLKSPVLTDQSGVRLIVTQITDWNNDLSVNVQDIFGFLSSWFLGEGDFNGDGTNDVADIFFYLSAWFAQS